jgi:hypothetical protein
VHTCYTPITTAAINNFPEHHDFTPALHPPISGQTPRFGLKTAHTYFCGLTFTRPIPSIYVAHLQQRYASDQYCKVEGASRNATWKVHFPNTTSTTHRQIECARRKGQSTMRDATKAGWTCIRRIWIAPVITIQTTCCQSGYHLH